MFKHTLPVCQAGSDTLSWALCKRGHVTSTLAVFYTNTYNIRRLDFVFPWQSVAAIFPRCMALKHSCVATNRVCPYMCVWAYMKCYLVWCRGQMFRHSLGSFLSWPNPCPHIDAHQSELLASLHISILQINVVKTHKTSSDFMLNVTLNPWLFSQKRFKYSGSRFPC